MQERRFLIIAASIGSGHVKAAEAVAEELKIKYPVAFIKIVDFSAWRVSWITAFMKVSYLFMLKFIPNLYEFLYRFTGGKAGGLSMQSLISAVTARDVRSLVRRYQPDIVLCTHPFPAGAVSWRKERHPDEFLYATVITDYSVHQMWIYPNVERYFVAREGMKTDLIAAGLPAENIIVSGIPVAADFQQQVEKKAVLSRLGFDADIPIVLLMGGGLGLGGVELALMELEKLAYPIQVLVVAGHNEVLKTYAEEMAQRSRHRVLVWGFSATVHEYMAVASFIISKPGALTISEALASELPMLLHDPIPGPEAQNAAYMARRGVAVWINDSQKLGEAINELLTTPKLLKEMALCAKALKRPNAAQDIVAALTESMADRKDFELNGTD